MNFYNYRNVQAQEMTCTSSDKIGGKWYTRRPRACLSAFQSPSKQRLAWELDMKVDKLEAIAVYAPMMLRGTAPFRSLVNYITSAPQYNQTMRYDPKRKWMVCDSVQISAEAMCHAFRNYLNIRERPAGAILFHALTADGVDADAAFLVSMAFGGGMQKESGNYLFQVARPVGHNGVNAIPYEVTARQRVLQTWKDKRPSGLSYVEAGYARIARYSGPEPKTSLFKDNELVCYSKIKKVALSYL